MANGNFFSELKRRNVYRVGAAYAVAGFVLIEVVSNVAPVFNFPGWIAQAVILLLVIGFPAVLCFAWVYEFTPDGLKRTAEVETRASVTYQTGHRLNIVIIGLFITMAGVYGAERFLLPDEAAEGAARTSAEAPVAAPAVEGISIAVLPFVNLSSDPEQEFFSDGMTEEITSALAKVKSLRVVGRTSAFEFKGQNKDLRTIGKALGASHILEGSIRKEGEQIRVTAQLIKADDGTHIWTDNYDRELKGIFAVQDEIARSMTTALRVPLGLAAGEALVPNRMTNTGLYQEYLRAKTLAAERGGPLAIPILERVVAGEPDYAPAWAMLATLYAVVDDVSLRPKTRPAAEAALRLDPGNARARNALANLARSQMEWAKAEDLHRQALALDPDDPFILAAYSNSLQATGFLSKALNLMETAHKLEPFTPVHSFQMALTLNRNGRYSAAIEILRALSSVGPIASARNTELARALAFVGRYGEAADALLGIPNSDDLNRGSIERAARLLQAAANVRPSPADLPVFDQQLSFVYVVLGTPTRLLDLPERLAARGISQYFGGGLSELWQPSLASVRKTARFKALMREAKLVDYWRARGWPDLCRPVGTDDFECD